MRLSDYPNLEFLCQLENPGERKIDPKRLKQEIQCLFDDYSQFAYERDNIQDSLHWHSKEKARLERIIDDLQADLTSARRAVDALTTTYSG